MSGRDPHDDSTNLDTLTAADPGVAALAYAAAGLAVLPLHTPDAEGACSCRRACGRDTGKHPRTAHGLSDATTDPDRIASWWELWPDANIGVRTGADSGLVVLDIDAGSGGEASIAALEAEHDALPDTWAVETGGGGLHLWYRHPGGRIPNSAGALGPGLDIRGDGGYVVAPPSRHRSGTAYRWGEGWSPERVPCGEVPAWLIAKFVTPVRAITPSHPHDGAPIPSGSRNPTLASLAGTMRRVGMTEAAILAALVAENAARCTPPLDAAEVAKIARSIATYPAAPRLAAPLPPLIVRRGRERSTS